MIFVALYLYIAAIFFMLWMPEDEQDWPQDWLEWSVLIFWPVTVPIAYIGHRFFND